jgi:hypothetical protein
MQRRIGALPRNRGTLTAEAHRRAAAQPFRGAPAEEAQPARGQAEAKSEAPTRLQNVTNHGAKSRAQAGRARPGNAAHLPVGKMTSTADRCTLCRESFENNVSRSKEARYEVYPAGWGGRRGKWDLSANTKQTCDTRCKSRRRSREPKRGGPSGALQTCTS